MHLPSHYLPTEKTASLKQTVILAWDYLAQRFSVEIQITDIQNVENNQHVGTCAPLFSP
jgi:hypothetical protein